MGFVLVAKGTPFCSRGKISFASNWRTPITLAAEAKTILVAEAKPRMNNLVAEERKEKNWGKTFW